MSGPRPAVAVEAIFTNRCRCGARHERRLFGIASTGKPKMNQRRAQQGNPRANHGDRDLPTQKFHKTMTRWLHRNGAPFFPVLAVMHDARVLLNYSPACNLPGREHGSFWLERGGMAPNSLVGDE